MIPRRRGIAFVALLLASCSNGTAVVRESTVPVGLTTPSSTTNVPMTSAPTTIGGTTTVRETTTTVAPVAMGQPTPTAPAQAKAPTLPVPVAPPDPQAPEPVLTLGTIEIPRIGLNKSMYEGITIPTLNRGPGHWPGTALPGAMGNVVVGGHRTSKDRPFRHLEKLVPGDEVIFTTDAGRFVYRVVRTEVVTPDAIWIVNQTEAYTATLFACHPVGSTKERIVVFLELSV